MNKKTIFFISIFFSFSVIVSISPNAWFIYFPKQYLYWLSAISICLQLCLDFFFHNKFKENIVLLGKNFSNSISLIFLFLISLTFIIFFPVKNLNLGDGILLLEHVALEAKIFGYLLTMDEILEAFIHSILFAKYRFLFSSPIEVYRLVSTVSGLFALGIIFYYFKKFKISILGYILVLSSGGMYLFHGYSENYTIVTTVLWFYILFSLKLILTNKYRNLQALLPISFIACILILLHLVSGYLLFSLIYLCYHFSDEGKFIRNAIYSTLFSLCILMPVFLYFSFFSEVRFDFTQTHLTNPKFYPVSKIIFVNHFRDILFCIFGSAFLPFILLIYFGIFRKNECLALLKRKEFQFLVMTLLGFSIHGFVHYPQLGFPADWDLMAFFWSPICFMAVFGMKELQNANNLQKSGYLMFAVELIPVYLFAISLFVLNAFFLNIPENKKIAELNNSLNRIDRFSESKEAKLLVKVKPEYKKFYLKVSYFLYESGEKLKEIENETSKKLQDENKSYEVELENHIDNVSKDWQKDFYSRLTRYHLEYLDLEKKKEQKF